MSRNRKSGACAWWLSAVSAWLVAATYGAGAAWGETWRIPQQVATIKAAVEDSASYGDTVLVSSGTYDTTSGEIFPISMRNGVVLTSEDGASATIVDARSTGRVIECSGCDSTTLIAGLTISGGVAPSGGGIYCINSDLEIRENVIVGNTANGSSGSGGGIFCHGGVPAILNNRISENSAPNWMGGGIYCYQSSGEIAANTVSWNTAMYGGGMFNDDSSPDITGNLVERNEALATGGGVDCYRNSSPTITRNVIIGNYAGDNAPAIACCYNSSPVIALNTIAGNTGDYGGGVRSRTGSSAMVMLNAIVDNVDGVYLEADSDTVVANNNNIYFNSFQTNDFEVVNETYITLDLVENFWWYADSATIGASIYGGGQFVPYHSSPCGDAPGEPSAVTSVVVMSNSSYTDELSASLDIGDTLFIEVHGADWNPSLVEPAIVIVTSSKDPDGIVVALIETGPATGVYRGIGYIATSSNDLFNEIGTNTADTLSIEANGDRAQHDRVLVGVTSAYKDPVEAPLPSTSGLLEVCPNPFSAATEMRFSVPWQALATLRVYNTSGRLVRTLVDAVREAGSHAVVWDGRGGGDVELGSGAYWCRLEVGGLSGSRKVVILR